MFQPLTVVMYHYVRRIEHSRYEGIKGLEVDLFIEQLEFFAKHYHVVTMEQVFAAKYDNQPLPDKALLLTFDDGYAEHFTYVYPILKRMGLQGSFYVPAKTVLEHKVLDVNKIHFILASAPDVQLLVESLRKEIASYQAEYNLKSFEVYYSEFAVANRFDCKEVIFVKRMLQHVLPETLRNTISDKLFSEYVGMNEEAFCRELYMDKYQLEQLVRDGMHVGCHGYDHYWWNKLEAKALKRELVRSKEFLVSIGCDMEKWTACYPYGSSSEDVVKELELQGCGFAFTTETNVAQLSNDHSLLLPRLDTNDLPKDKQASVNHWYKKA
ncbi:polysaccharide deacetylase family protein [Vibrio sp. OPT18]|uniref:polysaccharide deacetylase family protein n=1 Tax=Vibrio sp. OPT18 TaxID=2778641 RepID=UPI001881AA4B|nr:polysaccharide deacetylase family protein [Vibrio sp. OPT18]MBE8578973.1 polysaccharide deacetylase family protein [Vibrio sp. OPT18]